MRRALLLGLLLVSCNGLGQRLERHPVLALSGCAPAFRPRASDGALQAAGRLPTDAERVLGADLAERGVLPVAVRLGRAAGAGPRELRGIQAELVLQDGTRLVALPADRVAQDELALSERLATLSLPLGPLGSFDAAPGRFLYFRLDPTTRLRGRYALVEGGQVHREVDLLGSLLVLALDTDGGPSVLRLGLESGASGAQPGASGP